MSFEIHERKGATSFKCPNCRATIYAIYLSVMCEYCQCILPDPEDMLTDVESRMDFHSQSNYMEF